MIGILNRSTLVTDSDVQKMVSAVAHQIRYHLAPAWGQHPVPVIFYTDVTQIPSGAWAIAILDDSDQANILGWHTEDQGDLIYGRVFARPSFDAGSSALGGPYAVSATLSHEVCETHVDNHCNLWADSGSALFALEVCDPCESVSYSINVSTPTGLVPVSVSDFCFPAWFDALSKPTARFTFRSSVKAPFTLTKGGYVIKQSEGTISQVFGDEYPEWKKATKLADTSRTARRTKGGN